MVNKKQKRNLTISGFILSTPGHDYFEFRCTICCKKTDNSPTFSRWASLRIHTLKYHKDDVGLPLKHKKYLEEQQKRKKVTLEPLEVIKCEENMELKDEITAHESDGANFDAEIEMVDCTIIKQEDLDLKSINLDAFCEENEPVMALDNVLKDSKDLKTEDEDSFQYDAAEAESVKFSSSDESFKIKSTKKKKKSKKYNLRTRSQKRKKKVYEENNSTDENQNDDDDVYNDLIIEDNGEEDNLSGVSEININEFLDLIDNNDSNDDDEDYEGDGAEEEAAAADGDENVAGKTKELRDFSDVDGINVMKTQPIKNGPCYKRICFNLPKNKLTILLIELLHQTPAMWSIASNKERKVSYEKWIQLFKEQHNITFTNMDLTTNLRALRYFYNRTLKLKHLDEAAKYIKENCEGLPKSAKDLKLGCEHCDKFFKTQINLQAHIFLKHKLGESPFKCVECNKSFHNAYNMDFHMRNSHTQEFSIRCSVCNKGFLTKCELSLHMPIHTGINRYICATCGKSFRKRWNLTNHETRIHLRQRNFACHMCEKAFYTKSLLKDHINMHLGIKNFICPFCSKAFHSCHALMRHKQIHSEVKRYTCKLCDAAFHQFVGLNAHMKKRHQFIAGENEAEQQATGMSTIC